MKTCALTLLALLAIPAVGLCQVGGPRRTVPNIVGLQSGEARRVVQAAGLVYELAAQGEPTSEAAKNTIVARQTPAAGAQVAASSPVKSTLYVFVERRAAPPADTDDKGKVKSLGSAAPPQSETDDKGKVKSLGDTKRK
jgi:hypothetical protein